ncbi:hypothetical protein PUN28_004700 [Cardiocondyla obscurior]|uniref:Uncharacterized protein n=1 Tax=Cardiocondyla obscurior TaxID=286306 RepID=A0AAW2GE02_9HYME
MDCTVFLSLRNKTISLKVRNYRVDKTFSISSIYSANYMLYSRVVRKYLVCYSNVWFTLILTLAYTSINIAVFVLFRRLLKIFLLEYAGILKPTHGKQGVNPVMYAYCNT